MELETDVDRIEQRLDSVERVLEVIADACLTIRTAIQALLPPDDSIGEDNLEFFEQPDEFVPGDPGTWKPRPDEQ